MISTVIINADMALVRNETLEGRNYKAIPMVMLKEAVLCGSQGPTFYPADEIRKAPIGWNYKPVVVYHPSVNGQGVSATDPVIIENQKIGLIMNTRYADGMLKAEAWIDVEKADKVDPRVMESVNAGRMVEVSTGLFSDTEVVHGNHDGTDYGQVARNYVPDHLAVLPDKRGALSIEAGAGLLRNASEDDADDAQTKHDVDVPDVDTSIKLNETNTEPKMANPKCDAIATVLQLNDDDAKCLDALSEAVVDAVHGVVTATPEPVIHNSVEAALEAMAPDVKAVFNHGLESYQTEKSALIETITNASELFADDFLNARGIAELSAMASLIKNDEKPADEEDADDAAPAEEVPSDEEAPADEEIVENENREPAKFVGLSGIDVTDSLVLNDESDDFDMIPKGIDFNN